MGNSTACSQQKQWIEYHQLSQVPGVPTLLCSSYDSSLQGQKYLLSANLTQSQIDTYQSRRSPADNIVNIYDFSIKYDLSKCVSMFTYLAVVTQRIPYRLSMLSGLSREQGLYVLKNAVNGYKTLHKNYKTCYPNDRMIGILKNGVIKVWINEVWAKNLPDTPINRQDRMVDELINIVQDYVRRQQTTGFGNPFHEQINKRQRTFTQLQKVINHFIGNNLVQKQRQGKQKLKHRVKQLATNKAGLLVKYTSSSDIANNEEKQAPFAKSMPISRIQQLNLPIQTKRNDYDHALKVQSPVDNFNRNYTQRLNSDRQNSMIRRIYTPIYLSQNQQYCRGKASKSLPNQLCKSAQDSKNMKTNILSFSNILRSNRSTQQFFNQNRTQGQIRVNFFSNKCSSNSNTGITFGKTTQNDRYLKRRCVNQLYNTNNTNTTHAKDPIDFGLSRKMQQKINAVLKININGHPYQKNTPSRLQKARSPPISPCLFKVNPQSTLPLGNTLHNTSCQNSGPYPITPVYKMSNRIRQIQRANNNWQHHKRQLNFDLAIMNSQQSFGIGHSSDSITRQENQKNIQTGERKIAVGKFEQKTEEKNVIKTQFQNYYNKSNSGEQIQRRSDNMQTQRKSDDTFQKSLCQTPLASDQQPQATQKFTNMFKYYLQSYQGQNEDKQDSPSALEDEDLFKLQKQFEQSYQDQESGKINKFQLPVIEQGSEMDY